MKSKIVPEHLASAALTGNGKEANKTTILSWEAHMDEENKHATI